MLNNVLKNHDIGEILKYLVIIPSTLTHACRPEKSVFASRCTRTFFILAEINGCFILSFQTTPHNSVRAYNVYDSDSISANKENVFNLF